MTAPVTLPRDLVDALQPFALAFRSLSSRWEDHEDHWQDALSKPITVGQLRAASEALTAAPSERREPTREEIARVIDTLAFGITNDPPTDERRRNQRLSALYKADQILALFRGEG